MDVHFENGRWMEMARDRLYGGHLYQRCRMSGFCFHRIRYIFVNVLSTSHLVTMLQVLFWLSSVTIITITVTINLTGP
jgi:hypothetical protein